MTTYVYNKNASALTGNYSNPYIIFSDPAVPDRHNIAIYRTGEPIFEMWSLGRIVSFTMDTVEYDRSSKIATITYNDGQKVFLSLEGAPQEVLNGFEPYHELVQMPWATPRGPKLRL
jgi:hypothetical protein